MKKTCVAFLLAMMAASTASAFSIAVVDTQTVFTKSSAMKRINDELAHDFSARKKVLDQEAKTLSDEIASFQKNKSVMSKDKAIATQKKIASDEMALQAAQSKFQHDVMGEQGKKLKEAQQEIQTVVGKIAKQKKIDLVLASNAVLYSSDTADITADVEKEVK